MKETVHDHNWEIENASHRYHGQVLTSDEVILDELSGALDGSPVVDARRLRASVFSGVVTLRGEVTDEKQKAEAESCARMIEGVENVINLIAVSPWDNLMSTEIG